MKNRIIQTPLTLRLFRCIYEAGVSGTRSARQPIRERLIDLVVAPFGLFFASL